MKEICIKFAEWVGINTFDGRWMRHETNSISGSSRWRLYNEHEYIPSNTLYQKFCDENHIDFTIPQKILFWDKEFEPILFAEFIAKKGLFYYRWRYKGVDQDPYWKPYRETSVKYTTEELYKLFKSSMSRDI